MKRRIHTITLALLACLTLIWGCTTSDDTSGPTSPRLTTGAGAISGLVKDGAGIALAGVTVTAADISAVTDLDGYFSLREVPVGQQLVGFAKDTYGRNFRLVDVRSGDISYDADIVLRPTEIKTIDAASGGTVATSDGRFAVTFAPGGFVTAAGAAYTGNVTVELGSALPSEDSFHGVFPGRYAGVRADDSTAAIQSFGFVSVDLRGAGGASLQLAAGTTAGLTLDIGDDVAANAPASLPLWYYDEKDGQWHEEGTATLTGTTYAGAVAHFSIWNFDSAPSGDEICLIAGVVRDTNGMPVSGATVTAVTAFSGLGDQVVSDDDGSFILRGLTGTISSIWAVKFEMSSARVEVDLTGECSADPVLQDVVVQYAESVFLVTLHRPDLSHLLDTNFYIPMTWDDDEIPDFDFYHVYRGNVGMSSVFPFVGLQSLAGIPDNPEYLFGSRFPVGTNEYWVHSFDSSQAIFESGALVHIQIGLDSWIFEAADLAAPTAGSFRSWHVFDLEVSANGDVEIVPVMQFEIPPTVGTLWPDGTNSE